MKSGIFKRAIAAAVCGVLILSLAACGGGKLKTADRDLDIMWFTIGMTWDEVVEIQKNAVLLSDDYGRLEYELDEFIEIKAESITFVFDSKRKVVEYIRIDFDENVNTDNILAIMNETYGISDEAYKEKPSVVSRLEHIWFDKSGNYFQLVFYTTATVDEVSLFYTSSSSQKSMYNRYSKNYDVLFSLND